MKLKGINPVEQHVERIVLGVVAVVFLAALAMQFVLTPNQVEVSAGRSVGPEAVLTTLDAEAGRVLGQVQDPSPVLPTFETPALAERLEAGLDEPVLARDYAAAPLGRGVEFDVGDVGAQGGPVVALAVPEPAPALAAGYWATVDPYFVREHPQVARFVPAQQPYDTPGVSIEAAVPVEPLLAALREAPEGRRPIPRGWWSAGIEILDVQAQRQRLQPDGSWGPPEPVGRPSWMPTVQSRLRDQGPAQPGQSAGAPTHEITPATLTEMVSLSRTEPWLTGQPAYLRTIAGLPWVPPSRVSERNDRILAREEAERLRQEIAGIEERIADLQGRGGGPGRQGTPPTNPRNVNPPPGGPAGNTPGGGGRQTTQRDQPSRVERSIERLQAEITELETELAALDLGEDDQAGRRGTGGQSTFNPITPRGIDPVPSPAGMRPSDPGPGGFGGRSIASTGRGEGLLTQDEARVWTHDLEVTPGAEYRYRVRIGVNNPLFGRAKLLGSEDPELLAEAEEPLAYSPWSAWSEPIEVDRRSYYFVTGATDRGQIGRTTASATIELYQMYYGYYRRATESVEPGDPLEADFPVPDGLYTFDLDRIDPAAVAEYLMPQDATRRAARRPGSPMGPVGLPVDPQDETLPAGEPPVGVSALETRLDLGLESVLLDIAVRPSDLDENLGVARDGITEVFFFDPLQGIVVRRPDRDTQQERYRRVSLSAKAGQSADLRAPEPGERP